MWRYNILDKGNLQILSDGDELETLISDLISNHPCPWIQNQIRIGDVVHQGVVSHGHPSKSCHRLPRVVNEELGGIS